MTFEEFEEIVLKERKSFATQEDWDSENAPLRKLSADAHKKPSFCLEKCPSSPSHLGDLCGPSIFADSCQVQAVVDANVQHVCISSCHLLQVIQSAQPQPDLCCDGSPGSPDFTGRSPFEMAYDDVLLSKIPVSDPSFEVAVCDRLRIIVSCAMASALPGMICLQMNADLAFETNAIVEKGRSIVQSLRREGVDTKRVLLEVPGTWESIQACAILSKEGIKCCVNSIFCLVQLQECIRADAAIVNIPVGKITDWHRRQPALSSTSPAVEGVSMGGVVFQSLLQELRNANCETKIMASSIHNVEDMLSIHGSDFAQVDVTLIEEFIWTSQIRNESSGIVFNHTAPQQHSCPTTATVFRHRLNSDAMASDSLNESLRVAEHDLAMQRHLVRWR